MKSIFDAIVVGSGPSGLSCAYTLVNRGCRVRLIDAGGFPSATNMPDLDPFSTNINRRRWIENGFWDHGAVERDRSRLSDDAGEQEHFFANCTDPTLFDIENAGVRTALSIGGFSNVWGGAVLPISEIDAEAWPISRYMLDPYYKELCQFMTISSQVDGLDSVFSIENAVRYKEPIRKQAAEFLNHLDAYRCELEQEGLYFGRSKLAVDPGVPNPAMEHKYGPLFNSAEVLVRLLSADNFSLIENTRVEKLNIDGGRARLFCRSMLDQSKTTFCCEKLFLAGGAINTTYLLAHSFFPKRKEFYIRTNSNLLFPFLRYKRTRHAIDSSQEDYPEVFMELSNPYTYSKFVHFQIYSYGYYVLSPMARFFGKTSARFMEHIGQPLFERLMVFQCMFHSDYSDQLLLKLGGGPEGEVKASIVGLKSKYARQLSRKMFKLLFAKRKLLGGIPLRSLARHYPPGASFHLGSSFPMAKTPKAWESNILGQLEGLDNLHVVDATVLPNLPAPTVTYTVMANASRIAANA